jgi:hypothetical protein
MRNSNILSKRDSQLPKRTEILVEIPRVLVKEQEKLLRLRSNMIASSPRSLKSPARSAILIKSKPTKAKSKITSPRRIRSVLRIILCLVHQRLKISLSRHQSILIRTKPIGLHHDQGAKSTPTINPQMKMS